jgi:Ca-activated chloride channel family protein
MRLVKVGTLVFCSLASLALFIAQAGAQESAVSSRVTIVPQSRSFTAERRGRVEISEVDVGVVILEQVATTTMDISIRNPGTARLESELLVPVPEGAVVRGFTFQGAAGEPTAQVLTKEEARKAYEAIVAKIRDPALLEFVGYNLIRSSVFPVEAGGTQKVRLTYEHILAADGERVDYVLVRSESLEYNVPWKIAVKIKAKRPISTVYSPSHRLDVLRSGENTVSAQIAADDRKKPGPFLLSYLVQRDGISASLFAYPDLKLGGGYFLLLAGLPDRSEADRDEPAIKREVTLVIDRSGSMRDKKLEQVREAAMQIIAGLKDGEAFNILTYGNSVDFFSREPVLKSKESEEKAFAYLKGIRPSGGTNIHDALTEALRERLAPQKVHSKTPGT